MSRSKAKYHIYRNLHTGGFSVKYKGKVIDRDNFFIAEGITFKVNKGGRQSVIRQQQKNVHAYVVCDKYMFAANKDLEQVDRLPTITYNPYVADYFTCDNKKIENATAVLFCEGKCYLLEK